MLAVKFQGPIIIDEKNLSALLSLAGVGAVVEPYSAGAPAGAKPGRKPRAAAEAPAPVAADPAPAEPQASAPADTPVKKKRGRPAKAKPAADATEPAKEPAKEPAAETAPKAPSKGADDLLERFSNLIDTDIAAAKELLGGYGVERFSDLGEEHYKDFGAKLAVLGV